MYYIFDPTVSKQASTFNKIEELVKHLEGTVQRRFHLSRQDYMQNLIDLGHGYDDGTGHTFTRAMSEHFDIGVIRNSIYVRCDVHTARHNAKYKDECGD